MLSNKIDFVTRLGLAALCVLFLIANSAKAEFIALDFAGISEVQAIESNGALDVQVSLPGPHGFENVCDSQDVIVQRLGSTLRIETDFIDCIETLIIPRGLKVYLETSNGSVSFNGGARELKILAHNGAVSAHKVNGRAEIFSGNGDILVSGARGGLDAEASNGRITAQNIKGRTNIRSENGQIIVKKLRLKAATRNKLKSKNGSILVKGVSSRQADGRQARLAIRGFTENGTVRLPGKVTTSFKRGNSHQASSTLFFGRLKASLQLNSGNGDIEVN